MAQGGSGFHAVEHRLVDPLQRPRAHGHGRGSPEKQPGSGRIPGEDRFRGCPGGHCHLSVVAHGQRRRGGHFAELVHQDRQLQHPGRPFQHQLPGFAQRLLGTGFLGQVPQQLHGPFRRVDEHRGGARGLAPFRGRADGPGLFRPAGPGHAAGHGAAHAEKPRGCLRHLPQPLQAGRHHRA